jgi:hypothetical protein
MKNRPLKPLHWRLGEPPLVPLPKRKKPATLTIERAIEYHNAHELSKKHNGTAITGNRIG